MQTAPKEIVDDVLRSTLLQIEQIKQEWEATADSLGELICLLDSNMCIMRANRTVESWNLSSVEAVRGISVQQLLHPQHPNSYLNEFIASAQDVVQTEKEARLEINDEILERYLQYQIRPIFQDIDNKVGKSFAVLIVRDITEYKKLEEQFQQAQKMEVIGRLAGGVAHDFNNILTIITGHADFLRIALDDSADNSNYQDVEQIQKACERASMLTRRLLAFTRKDVIQVKIVNLNHIIEDMQKMLRRLITVDIDFKLSLASNIKPIQADAGQIEQILMNLTINACDAMPHGGTISIHTETCYLDSPRQHGNQTIPVGHYVLLKASDTGFGMTPETKARIFEPFFTTKEMGKGTGLGLSIIYNIVKQNHGYIVVESTPNQGTTFYIYWPEHQTATLYPIQVTQIPKTMGGSETILLVEDEPNVRHVTRTHLVRQGYTVLEASRAERVWPLLEEQTTPIDLLITDVVLPDINGYDLAQALQQQQPQLKVLFISGYPDSVLPDKNVTLLEKPFTSNMLLSSIRTILDADIG